MQVVTTHKHTDFDALASMIAATLVYPDAVPVLSKPLNPNVKEFLSIHKDLLKVRSWQEIDSRQITGLIIVDTGSWDRLSVPADIRGRTDVDIILYDHHPQEGDIPARLAYREQIGANISLMLRPIMAMGEGLTPIQATLFLAGLYEDTGSLSFPSTTPEDARAAAYLLEQKADLNLLGYLLRPAYRQKQKEILFEMLQSGRRSKIDGLFVAFSRLSLDGFVENLAVVVHMYREILNADAAFGLFQDKDRGTCTVIARSNGDKVDVGSIMRSLGGGGHPGAASAQVRDQSMEAVEGRIRDHLTGTPRVTLQVKDLMSSPVVSVSDRAPMSEAARLLREKGCTGLPVVDGEGHLVGVLSRRDFTKKIRKESQLEAPVKAFMSTAVVTIAAEKSPLDASRLMIKHDIGRIPVLQDDAMVGIITRSDVMAYWYDLMPD